MRPEGRLVTIFPPALSHGGSMAARRKGAARARFKLMSPDIRPNGPIAMEQVYNGFGCSGQNVSPALKWSGAPEATKSFALLVQQRLSLLVLALAMSGAWAQSYPAKPVRLVVPFGPGGPDALARLLGAQLTQQMGQPFVVENKPGANGVIGAEFVAKSAPDGHTLMVTSSGFVTAPSMYKKLPYDTERDFAPVTNLVENAGIFVAVNPGVPARTLQELIELARRP